MPFIGAISYQGLSLTSVVQTCIWRAHNANRFNEDWGVGYSLAITLLPCRLMSVRKTQPSS